MALETNLRGSLAENGSVDGTLPQWQDWRQKLSRHEDQLAVRHAFVPGVLRRLHPPSPALRRKIWNSSPSKTWRRPKRIGVAAALEQAREILNQATIAAAPQGMARSARRAGRPSLRETIGQQTSVAKYHGSGYERGCVMDFINYPLNNRWWLEDQFDRIAKMTDRGGTAQADRCYPQLGESR